MRKAIICDLDGTLITNPEWDGDLDKFYLNILDGFPNEWCVLLLKGFAKLGIKIIFITARNEKSRSQTVFQLNSWFDFNYELYMRGREDLREDYIIKEEYVKELLEKYDIILSIDDNPDNCIMFQNYFPTLQVFNLE